MITNFKIFEYQTNKKIYPYNEIKNFIDWFYNIGYGDVAEYEGWAIFDSGTEGPNINYISNGKYYNYWIIERIDEINKLRTDQEADKLAKKIGIMIDDKFGLVIGFNGINFLENPEKIKDACYINDEMEFKLKNFEMIKNTEKYNL